MLDYSFGAYTLVTYSGQTCTAVTVPTPVSTPEEDEFMVADFNLLRFFDTAKTPTTDIPVSMTTAFSRITTRQTIEIG